MNDPEPEEGGDNWQQQSGYGERVLDPDHGDQPSDAAGDAAADADQVQAPDQPPSHRPSSDRSIESED